MIQQTFVLDWNKLLVIANTAESQTAEAIRMAFLGQTRMSVESGR
jgi:RNA polymerase subunit RPABC4/transcription elongation factor Spt4